MSIFEPTTVQDSVPPSGQPNQSYLERLVQSKGDQWKDTEVLARGKLEADAYIESMKTKLAELEAQVAKETYSKDLLEKLSTPKEATPPAGVSISGDAKEQTTLDADKIKGLIADHLNEYKETSTKEANRMKAEKAFVDKHGANAPSILTARAKSLGVSVEFLSGVAEQAPEAFMALVDVDVKSEAGHVANTHVNTASGFNSSAKTFQEWEAIRRENPKVYWSPESQNQILRDQERLGSSKFYNRE